jgi:hypothetical protein
MSKCGEPQSGDGTDGRDSGDDLAKLEFVEDCGLSCGIKADLVKDEGERVEKRVIGPSICLGRDEAR